MLNRLPRHGAALLAIAALSTGAVACSSVADGARSSGTPNHVPSAPATGTPTPKTPPTGGSRPTSDPNDGSSSTGGTSTADKSMVGDTTSMARCHTADLKAGFSAGGGAAPDMKSTGQTRASVYLTNISRHTCSIIGFPGVDMVGDRANDGTWSLTRSSMSPTKILLKPSDTTNFSITLLPTTAPGAETFEPGLVRITPPDEKTQFALKWPWGGSIVRQDAATHPGTFVNPVGS